MDLPRNNWVKRSVIDGLPLSDDERVRVFVRTTPAPALAPDTGAPLSVEQMAVAFQQLGRPAGDDEALTVDPDDWPLT